MTCWTQTKIAEDFDPIYPNLQLKQPLISAWLRIEDKLWADWANTKGSSWIARCVQQTQHPKVTEVMDLW